VSTPQIYNKKYNRYEDAEGQSTLENTVNVKKVKRTEKKARKVERKTQKTTVTKLFE